MQALFEEGYRRHLRWHEEKEDPLVWYGWTVVTGERIGLFVDGSFGGPFSQFDARPEPQADVADFAQTTAPFSEPAFRSLYRLRADLSTGWPLEDRRPPPLVEVTRYRLHPGREQDFERFLGALRATLEATPKAPVHTWYELIVGGAHPGFMLMVPCHGWGDYAGSRTLTGLLEGDREDAEARALVDLFQNAVAETVSETWQYRRDLSYFPAEP